MTTYPKMDNYLESIKVIFEDAIEKRQSSNKDRNSRSSKPKDNKNGNKNRKRVSFEDEIEKCI